jgi:hypothetical protein
LNFACACSGFAIFTKEAKKESGYKQKAVLPLKGVARIAVAAKTFPPEAKKP